MNGRSHRIRARIKPVHPPFTHFPLAAYVFAAGFDITSAAGARHSWAGQLWHAGTFVLIAGLVICLITMGTGFWDLIRFWPGDAPDPAGPAGQAGLAGGGPDPLATVAAHVSVMAAAFMIGAGDVAWRLSDYDSRASTPPGVVALSLAAAIVACTGGYFGGKLVFRHAIGVAPASAASAGVAPAGVAPAGPTASTRLPAGPASDDHEHASDGRTEVIGRPAGPYRGAGWDGRGATRGDTTP